MHGKNQSKLLTNHPENINIIIVLPSPYFTCTSLYDFNHGRKVTPKEALCCPLLMMLQHSLYPCITASPFPNRQASESVTPYDTIVGICVPYVVAPGDVFMSTKSNRACE